MLRSPAQDLLVAPVEFSVSKDFTYLDRMRKLSKFSVSQHYINNTPYELTIMDAIGVKQTLPRKDTKGAGRDLIIVREYLISYKLEQEVRDRMNEVSSGDGEIIEAIQKQVLEGDYLSLSCFDALASERTSRGILIVVSLRVKENDIATNKSIECLHAGVVISRLKPHLVPFHPSYSFLNNKGFHPLSRFLKEKYVVFNVRANYHHVRKLKERFFYTIGTDVQEVEYTSNSFEPEGFIVSKITKDIQLDEVDETTVFQTEFEIGLQKNRFFTSKRDAMLSINTERSNREKEVELKERELVLKEQEQELRHRTLALETELSKVKLFMMQRREDFEQLSFDRNLVLAEQQHENNVENEKLKIKQLLLESVNLDNKGTLAKMEHNHLLVQKNLDYKLGELKHKTEVVKNVGALFKAQTSIAEDARQEQLEELKFENDLHRFQLDKQKTMFNLEALYVNKAIEVSAHKRKMREETSKNIGQGLNIIGGLMKMLG